MSDETYDFVNVTFSTTPKFLQDRCMIKTSDDGGETWWPRGAHEIHVAGEVYVLMWDGRYERKA
jgi:hypothetical protein